jgi:hypothetical protein
MEPFHVIVEQGLCGLVPQGSLIREDFERPATGGQLGSPYYVPGGDEELDTVDFVPLLGETPAYR